ncbi:MAG: ATP-binding protein [Gammaproteobacteria bacterium]|nr:ATP-binding protein [Gammaproteobacteria bacterium]
MHGLSGSGKSRTATRLAERLGAVHLRSDLERKRLLDASAPESLYGAEADALVYRHLESLSQQLLAAGHRVIVDATLLRAEGRAPFVRDARRLDLPVVIVACDAPLEVLLERVRQRADLGVDPSDADADVVLRQQARRQPPSADEADLVLVRNPQQSDDGEDVEAIERRFGSSRAPAGCLTILRIMYIMLNRIKGQRSQARGT